MTPGALSRGPAPAWSITPLSPVATAAAFCRLGGVLWATVVVKATFQLVHGEAARLIQPIDLVTADQAPSNHGSLERARETAPHLPNAGVLLTGHAHAPAGRAVPSMSVRLGISRDRPLIDKTLHVFGARAATAPSVIAPFQKMPLTYERAFGGAGVWENPVGMGGPGSASLPNLVDPRNPRRVAGFGPVAPQWAPRRALLGGLDPSTLGAAVWEVPERFDWRFFQAAPADQQLDRFHGDEWIVLDGMHPDLPRVQSRLPQVTAQARRQAPGAGAGQHPIELRADMLVIDADRLVASLVWRGRFAVPPAEALAGPRVLVGLELPDQSIAWPAAPSPKAQPYSTETQEVDVSAILGGAVPFAPDRPSVLSRPPAEPKPEPLSTGTAMVDVRAMLKGPVPFAAPAPTAELSLPAGVLSAPRVLPATVEGLPAAEALALPFAAADASRPSPASLPTPAAQKSTPMSTGTTDINLAEVLKGGVLHRGASVPTGVSPVLFSPLPDVTPGASAPPPPAELAPVGVRLPLAPPVLAPIAPVPGAVSPEAPPPAPIPPNFRPAASAPAPPVLPESTSGAAGSSSKRTGASLARSHASESLGERLDGQDFAGADLSGLDLSGRSLVRCILRGARLRGANLAAADLTRAVLDEADVRGANLSGAALRDASFVRADLERANLSRCRAESASFVEANLAGADLRGARLAATSFERAVLRQVEAAGADLTEARMDGADLSEATFRRVQASKASLAGANLDGADFRGADLEGADLRGTSRRLTKLAGAKVDAGNARDQQQGS